MHKHIPILEDRNVNITSISSVLDVDSFGVRSAFDSDLHCACAGDLVTSQVTRVPLLGRGTRPSRVFFQPRGLCAKKSKPLLRARTHLVKDKGCEGSREDGGHRLQTRAEWPRKNTSWNADFLKEQVEMRLIPSTALKNPTSPPGLHHLFFVCISPVKVNFSGVR